MQTGWQDLAQFADATQRQKVRQRNGRMIAIHSNKTGALRRLWLDRGGSPS